MTTESLARPRGEVILEVSTAEGDAWEQHLLPAPDGGGHKASVACWCEPGRVGVPPLQVWLHSSVLRAGGDCCPE